MTTKNMKGLFKGLRYIGQIFDEENKDDEIQIGLPTDVKHVAHIGWDGPSQAAADANPSWMKEFKANPNPGFQSGPLDSSGNNAENPEIKWVSEDSKKVKRAKDVPAKDQPELPRSSRRRNSSDTTNSNTGSESPKKKDPTKPRQSRRHNSKDASEGSVKSSRQPNESGQPGSPSRGHPDGEKKTRRKKSKDTEGGGGGSTRSKSKDVEGGGSTKSRSKPASSGNVPDPGADTPSS